MSGPVDTMPHPAAASMTFGRRVGLAAVLFLAGQAVSYTLQLVSVGVSAYRLAPWFGYLVPLVLNFGAALAVIFCIRSVLGRAQRSIAEGRPHWLASMPEPRLIGALVALLAVSRIAPRIAWDSSMFGGTDRGMGSLPAVVFMLPGGALAAVSCYIWIWWCDRPPRTERLLFVSALAWVGFEFLLVVLDMVAPTLNLLATRTPDAGWSMPLPGSDAFVTVNLNSWIWRVGFDNVMSSLGPWAMHIAVTTPIAAAVALAFYAALNRSPKP